MNCLCNPPKLAVIRTTQKQNDNSGKEFFGCANGGCNFFSWMGATMPASFQSSNQAAIRSPKRQSNLPRVAVRLTITKFEDGPPTRIWFGVFHTHNAKLTQFYLSFAKDKRQYIESTRNWSFDFCMYEELVNQLQATEFEFVELIDLPRFLVIGLKRYIEKKMKLQIVLPEEASSSETEVDIPLNIESNLLDLLLPFQLEGIKYVIRHGGKTLIGDDMVSSKHHIVVVQSLHISFP
jgi:GRF zinc finger